MTKRTLRQLYKSKRNEIADKDRLKWDDLMLIQFQKMDLSFIHTVLSYWPLENQVEPNTRLFTGYLRHMFPNIVLCYPVTDMATIQMKALVVNENTLYTKNALGIIEPDEGELMQPEKVDLVLVPLLAYDINGFRVGYGKGYYDRYLASCSENCLKIGFSYFDPIDQITDTDQFDVPLSSCITPYRTYEF